MYKILFTSLLFPLVLTLHDSCKKNNTVNQKDDVEIEYVFHEGERDFIRIFYYIKNNTDKPISILGSIPTRRYPNGMPSSDKPPEFFEIEITPNDKFCETAPYQAGTRDVKTKSDFIFIPPFSQREMVVYTSYYDKSICDENLDKIQVKLTYDFDKNLLNKKYFIENISFRKKLTPEESDQLYELIKNSYQGEIKPVEKTINLNTLKPIACLEKKRYTEKAKREYNIEISNFFPYDYTNKISAVIIENKKELNEKQLKFLNRNIDNMLPPNAGTYIVVKENKNTDKIIASINKEKYVIYDFKDIKHLTDSITTNFYKIKNETPLKEHEVYGIYYHTKYLYLQYHLLTKYIIIISKDKEGKYYHSYYDGGESFNSSLTEMTLEDNQFHTTFGTYSLKKEHTLVIQENGDLADYLNRYYKENYQKCHRYFIKMDE